MDYIIHTESPFIAGHHSHQTNLQSRTEWKQISKPIFHENRPHLSGDSPLQRKLPLNQGKKNRRQNITTDWKRNFLITLSSGLLSLVSVPPPHRHAMVARVLAVFLTPTFALWLFPSPNNSAYQFKRGRSQGSATLLQKPENGPRMMPLLAAIMSFIFSSLLF